MAGLIAVYPSHPLPIYAQLDRAIRAAVATGRLGPGAQLPTVRQLAVELKVNANTVARVYLDLERSGVLETRRGVGTFVTDSPAASGSKRERQSALAGIVRRCLEEAAAQGFTADDVRRQMVAKATEE